MSSGRSLFFVAGTGGSPEAAIRAVGGTVVTHLPGDRVLAVAALESLGRLQAHPTVALAGPVSVDPARFAAFARLVGLDAGGGDDARPP